MSEPAIELREQQPYLGIHAPSIDGIRQFADAAFPELFAPVPDRPGRRRGLHEWETEFAYLVL